jgi:3-(3-hydroxy-phenyl)propionate hydroxylase
MLLPGEDDQAMMAPEVVDVLVGAWLKDVPHRIIRAATYRFHGLVAKAWKVGGVFLAGDAAHQTPPFFGQGMCHGFRDAANLAWKMIAVARRQASDMLLETYQRERDPHVRAVIGAAVAAGRYICELDPAKARIRDAEMRMRALNARGETAHDLIPAISAGVILPGSTAAGERFIQPFWESGRLDDFTGGGWRLFVRGQVASDVPAGIAVFDASGLRDGGAVEDWLAARDADAVLVRPDHYVFGTASGDGSLLSQARDAIFARSWEMAA